MNNMPYPYFPGPFPQMPPQNNIEEDLNFLKMEITKLKDRLDKLEDNKKNDYLKKDDSLYML